MGRRGKLSITVLLVGVSFGVSFGVSLCGNSLDRRVRAEEGATAASAQKKPARKQQQQLAGAKVLYLDNCARCHGADGRGQTVMGKVFKPANLADAQWWKKERVGERRLTASIRDGRGQMPAFGKQFSKAEIAALVSFVKTFNGK